MDYLNREEVVEAMNKATSSKEVHRISNKHTLLKEIDDLTHEEQVYRLELSLEQLHYLQRAVEAYEGD